MSALDQPLDLPCGLRLPNRIALAPLTNQQSEEDGRLGEEERRWLTRRAGSFGLVSTCAASVALDGRAWPGQLGIHDDRHLPGLTQLAHELRAAGSAAVVQIHHGGALAERSDDRIAPAADEHARAATDADLERVIADFTAAALRAQEAGFDGVEIHGANGYLLTQFLAPLDNPRDDAWGGDLDRRAALLRRTLRAVREAADPAFAVGVRLSPVDVWAQRGLVLADGVRVAAWCAEDGADFVHLSLADACGPPPFEATEEPVLAAVRAAVPDEVPLIVAGRIWTRRRAERAEALGASVVALGLAGIVHPDWPQDSLRPDFAPAVPHWTPDQLRAAAVGEAFLGYLRLFPGLVEGGKPARAEA
jgi:2,4-dienoyl-CoA reductase-like NADH-dependent reductase (Old Yellow Enzyme family)